MDAPPWFANETGVQDDKSGKHLERDRLRLVSALGDPSGLPILTVGLHVPEQEHLVSTSGLHSEPDRRVGASSKVAGNVIGSIRAVLRDRRKARLMIEKAVADDPALDAARALLEELRAG